MENETGSFVSSGVDAVSSALVEMGISAGREALELVEGWLRFYEGWAGRRVVGFGDVGDIAVKLIADSFAVEKALAGVSSQGEGLRAIDLGSGNGWPGLAVKALMSGLSLVLLDSRLGACRFLRKYLEEAGIPGVAVVPERAEKSAKNPEHAGKYHLVTTRAMARPGVSLELSAPYCAPQGKVALWLGPEYESKVEGKTEIPELGIRLACLYKYVLPGGRGRRSLAVYIRTGGFARGYPRSLSSMRAKPLL
jgi:16S rRNA (guanine527-N7)-methyltransferase